jgi:hypothetical protein
MDLKLYFLNVLKPISVLLVFYNILYLLSDKIEKSLKVKRFGKNVLFTPQFTARVLIQTTT